MEEVTSHLNIPTTGLFPTLIISPVIIGMRLVSITHRLYHPLTLPLNRVSRWWRTQVLGPKAKKKSNKISGRCWKILTLVYARHLDILHGSPRCDPIFKDRRSPVSLIEETILIGFLCSAHGTTAPNIFAPLAHHG